MPIIFSIIPIIFSILSFMISAILFFRVFLLDKEYCEFKGFANGAGTIVYQSPKVGFNQSNMIVDLKVLKSNIFNIELKGNLEPTVSPILGKGDPISSSFNKIEMKEGHSFQITFPILSERRIIDIQYLDKLNNIYNQTITFTPNYWTGEDWIPQSVYISSRKWNFWKSIKNRLS